MRIPNPAQSQCSRKPTPPRFFVPFVPLISSHLQFSGISGKRRPSASICCRAQLSSSISRRLAALRSRGSGKEKSQTADPRPKQVQGEPVIWPGPVSDLIFYGSRLRPGRVGVSTAPLRQSGGGQTAKRKSEKERKKEYPVLPACAGDPDRRRRGRRTI